MSTAGFVLSVQRLVVQVKLFNPRRKVLRLRPGHAEAHQAAVDVQRVEVVL